MPFTKSQTLLINQSHHAFDITVALPDLVHPVHPVVITLGMLCMPFVQTVTHSVTYVDFKANYQR